ncbi:MAG: DUF354 domain-containing protein [Rubricoccaceae bacterium]|nr:DUF354 domain-containing protein [Rubricoccaceae bacterium]
MKRYLFYLGHPAHFHLFRHVIAALKGEGHAVEILIKNKDVLEALLDAAGWPYRNVQRGERGDSRLRIAWSLLKRDVEVLRIARRFRPHLMMGTSAEIAHVGRLLGLPAVVVNEDDHDVVPLFAKLAYPFADALLAPVACRMGRWAAKTVFYESYHELAYLHPDRFAPDPAVPAALAPDGRPYVVLRFAQLNAHHDVGRSGITTAVAERLVERLRPLGHVHITAERPLEPALEPYRIRIAPADIHSALAGAHLYIGDSQTMAAEAAVLGTPSLRFNDFVGEIGYLEELEHRYGLTRGIRTDAPERLFEQVEAWLAHDDLRAEWARRRDRMLEDKVDLTAFLLRFIAEYPEPAGVEDPVDPVASAA